MEKREVVGCVSVVLAASIVNISEDDGGTMTCDNPTLAEKNIFNKIFSYLRESRFLLRQPTLVSLNFCVMSAFGP